jgi:hypothetical protein
MQWRCITCDANTYSLQASLSPPKAPAHLEPGVQEQATVHLVAVQVTCEVPEQVYRLSPSTLAGIQTIVVVQAGVPVKPGKFRCVKGVYFFPFLHVLAEVCVGLVAAARDGTI